MLSADPSRVTTCESPRVGYWTGLKRETPSAEVRAKLKSANLGKTQSAEARAKIAAANIGRPVSAETRAKISATLKGRILPHRSAESLAKQSATSRGRSIKGEIMTPWGKYHSSNMAKDCGAMLGIKNPNNKIKLGLLEDPENYYYIKDTK
jgi:hypothetical protein